MHTQLVSLTRRPQLTLRPYTNHVLLKNQQKRLVYISCHECDSSADSINAPNRLNGVLSTYEPDSQGQITISKTSKHIISANKQNIMSQEANINPQSTQTYAPLTVSQIVTFSLPALGSLLADPLMSLVDTAIISQCSTIDLAALGPNTMIFGFIVQLYSFFGCTTNALVSRSLGASDHAQAARYVSQGLMLAIGLGTATSALLILYKYSIFSALDVAQELVRPGCQYLVIRAISVPAVLVAMVGTAACLGRQDPATPLRFACISGVINLVGDVFLSLGPPKLGIVGAAAATVFAQYVSALLYIRYIHVRLSLVLRIPTWQQIKPYLQSSSALTVRSVGLMVCVGIVNKAANQMGTAVTAAHQVAMSLFTIAQFFPEPVSQAAQCFLACISSRRAYGAHSVHFTRASYGTLLTCAGVLGAGVALMVALVQCVMCYVSKDVQVAEMLMTNVPVLSCACCLISLVCVSDGVLIAMGDLRMQCVQQLINIPMLFGALTMVTSNDLMAIWLVVCLLQFTRLVENVLRFFVVLSERRALGRGGATRGRRLRTVQVAQATT